jgi:hypothetical protein
MADDDFQITLSAAMLAKVPRVLRDIQRRHAAAKLNQTSAMYMHVDEVAVLLAAASLWLTRND